jgi:DNA-binding NarL/FixJ family response regulator
VAVAILAVFAGQKSLPMLAVGLAKGALAGWHSRTATEQAVACLLAEGLNNNQVAARMYISTHTVAHNLRQAFRRLCISSRVELARIVIEQAANGTPTGS